MSLQHWWGMGVQGRVMEVSLDNQQRPFSQISDRSYLELCSSFYFGSADSLDTSHAMASLDHTGTTRIDTTSIHSSRKHRNEAHACVGNAREK